MRFVFFASVLMVFSFGAFAEKFTTTIHSIDLGKRDESHFVRFDNGRVTFIRSDKDDLLNTLMEIQTAEDEVDVVVDRKNFLVSVNKSKERDLSTIADYWVTDPEPFRPAVVKTTNAALKIFQRMRRDYNSGGQCYNRAHIWAYEEFKKTKLNSMKIFMFFTERYIRKYKYHWWFHVTPMVYVGSKSSPRTLDRRYTSGPRQTKTWSDAFIKSKRTCPIVKTFDAFWLNQQKQDCYHIHTSMYYVKPRDIEKRDFSGVEKVGFEDKEIQIAYKDAFKRRR